MLDNRLVDQGNTGLSRFSSTPSTSPMTLNSAAMNPQGQYSLDSGTGTSSIAKVSPSTSGQQNDASLTHSYLNALKNQQGATAAAQSLSGYTAPDPNKPQSALPNFTPEQQKQFQAMFGAIFGMQPNPGATSGLNAVANPPATTKPPTMVAGDNSRFENDPFKVNANALR